MTELMRTGACGPDECVQFRPSRLEAIVHALRLKCPNCGRAHLFRSYLKQVDECPACGESYGEVRSDDAAPWLTILIVGHLLVPVMAVVQAAEIWPMSFSLFFWPALAVAMMGVVLPRAKALMLAIIWYEKAPGSGVEEVIG